jgi:hypothetical protein
VTLTNSTVGFNTVTTGAAGAATATAGSPGAAGGGGIYNLSDGAGGVATLTLVNAIVSGSTGPNDIVNNRNNPGGGSAATITATSPNIVQTASVAQNGAVTNGPGVVNTNPLLAPLASNGGPTQPLALGAGSNAAAAALSQDQRTFNRVVNNGAGNGALVGGFFVTDPRLSDVVGVNQLAALSAGGRVGLTTVTGRAEIVTALGPGAPPLVNLFDGVTLALLDGFFAFDPFLRSGVFVGG